MEEDVGDAARYMLLAIQQTDQTYGIGMIKDILKGKMSGKILAKNFQNLPSFRKCQCVGGGVAGCGD